MNATTPRPTRRLNFRALITLLTGVSFLVMVISGVILYVAPRGRVANWTDWSLLGLDKEQWSDLHMTASVLLLVAIGFHLYFNWKPLCHHLKSRVAHHGIRLRELLVASAVTGLLVVGSIAGWPPFSSVPTANAKIKDAWERSAGSVGRAPSTYVQEATVEQFARRMDIPLPQLYETLRSMGIEVDDPSVPIDTLVRRHGVSLQSIYEAVRPHTDASEHGGSGGRRGDGGGDGGGDGYGQMTLSQLCQNESIPLDAALGALRAKGVEGSGSSRLRHLANQMDLTPRELAEWLMAADERRR